jgi:hypothetical protein
MLVKTKIKELHHNNYPENSESNVEENMQIAIA